MDSVLGPEQDAQDRQTIDVFGEVVEDVPLVDRQVIAALGVFEHDRAFGPGLIGQIQDGLADVLGRSRGNELHLAIGAVGHGELELAVAVSCSGFAFDCD